ncbi:MAG TPA: NAD(P)-dependent oxidoreductase [Verrucomicrobiae bacterium]|nr:NAD(P)-dependent oxidoreductase [Verrucomicrobiae bacterium]
MSKHRLPEFITTESELDEVLTRPSAALVSFIKSVASPLLILGAGGKMGPTLAVLARRAAEAASHPLEVIAVSRFNNSEARRWLEDRGVKTVSCDLLDIGCSCALPDAENICSLVGLKFGTAQNPSLTWAINTVTTSRICERYPRARIVALSTGNVYPFSEVARGGSREDDPLTPLGEYANAAIARERIFEHYSRQQGTPVALIRLFFAVELRYGVLVDIARAVQRDEPIDLANGSISWIWQGDANEMILRSLALPRSPVPVWNLCRPEIYSVRAVAEQFGQLLGKTPRFTGAESGTALLGNSHPLCEKLGPPSVPLETMARWIAHWMKLGGRNLERPTHFETRNGNY